MAIVTISHEMGSGGAELGMALASHLSYRHVDHDVILDRARTYGLAEDRLAHLEEDKPSSLSVSTQKPAGTSWSFRPCSLNLPPKMASW